MIQSGQNRRPNLLPLFGVAIIVFLVFAQACIRCFFWNALCCVDQDSLKRFYFFSDEFGSGETNGL